MIEPPQKLHRVSCSVCEYAALLYHEAKSDGKVQGAYSPPQSQETFAMVSLSPVKLLVQFLEETTIFFAILSFPHREPCFLCGSSAV